MSARGEGLSDLRLFLDLGQAFFFLYVFRFLNPFILFFVSAKTL